MTIAPSLASFIEVARPMPLLAPVTTAIFPFIQFALSGGTPIRISIYRDLRQTQPLTEPKQKRQPIFTAASSFVRALKLIMTLLPARRFYSSLGWGLVTRNFSKAALVSSRFRA
jgi:hypothetical protein